METPNNDGAETSKEKSEEAYKDLVELLAKYGHRKQSALVFLATLQKQLERDLREKVTD